jgi:N-acyl-phosphatidylethanolamine-hydrolysing phospholipase D
VDDRHGLARRRLSENDFAAPHGRRGAFFNPWEPMVFRLSRWLRARCVPSPLRAERRRPLYRPPRVEPRPSLPEPRRDALQTTWVGHSTFVVQDADDVVVTDPHWGRRALVLPRLTAPGVALAALPDEPIAIVSHDHYDHLDRDTVRRMPRGTVWFVPLGLARWFRRVAPWARVRELDWWQCARHGRFTVTFLPAQHWGNRLSHGRNAALWGAWRVESESRSFFFGGDSGYFGGYREIGRLFPETDLALLPIGAFEPREFVRYQHMDPAEAYRAFEDLRADTMVPMHWGTFDLGRDPPRLAPRLLRGEIARRGGDPERVRILGVGETWSGEECREEVAA